MKNEIKYRDPLDLKVHPRLKKFPEWSKDDERFYALTDDIRERGIDQPIIIVEGNLIVDGRHRWNAAKALQLLEIPTVERSKDEVYGIILNSLVQRRHYTKSALVYMAFPMFEEALEEIKKRQVEYWKTGGKDHSALNALRSNSIEDLADKLGISRRLFLQAQEVHKHFADRDDLREKFEPGILEEGKGLGAVLAGIGTILDQERKGSHGGGRPDDLHRQMHLFMDVVDKEISRWQYWGNFPEDQKREHFRYIGTKAAKLPPEQCKDLAAYHRQMAKEFDKAAKQWEEE